MRLWDVGSEQCAEIIQGTGDVSAIATGPTRFPCWTLERGDDTVVGRANSSFVLGRFRAGTNEIVTHPDGRMWVGAVSNHLYILTLEGRPQP